MSQLIRSGVRLAIRRDGEWIIAYLAEDGTMDTAIELSRLSYAAAEEDGGSDGLLYADWRSSIEGWVQRVLRKITGTEPELHEEPADPKERIQ